MRSVFIWALGFLVGVPVTLLVVSLVLAGASSADVRELSGSFSSWGTSLGVIAICVCVPAGRYLRRGQKSTPHVPSPMSNAGSSA